MQLFRIANPGPGFCLHPFDGPGVEQTEIRSFRRIGPTAIPNSIGATLFEWRVIQESIGSRINNFLGEG